LRGYLVKDCSGRQIDQYLVRVVVQCRAINLLCPFCAPGGARSLVFWRSCYSVGIGSSKSAGQL
jgi:hypothetical protein